MGIQTYDPTKTTVIVGDDEIEGFGPDTFVEVVPASPRFSTVQCCEGEVVRTSSGDQSGTVRLTLLPTSPSNLVLDKLRLADDESNGGVFSLQVTDGSAKTLIHAPTAWVSELPRVVVSGSGLQMREWTIACADLDWNLGGASSGAGSILAGLLGQAVNFVAGHLPFPV